MNAVPHYKGVELCQHQSPELFRRLVPPIGEARAYVPLVSSSLFPVTVAQEAKHLYGARWMVSSPQQPFLVVGRRPEDMCVPCLHAAFPLGGKRRSVIP